MLVGCSSGEDGISSDEKQQQYTVEDLVKIASKYGVRFQPNAEASSVAFSKADIDSFELKVKSLAGIEGKYHFGVYSSNKAKMLSKKLRFRLKTRTEITSSKDDSHDYPTYKESIYTCDCTLSWVKYYEGSKVCRFDAMLIAKVQDEYGYSVSDNLDTHTTPANLKYLSFSDWVTFNGDMEWPFEKGGQKLGHFTISYDGEYHFPDPDGSFINWKLS